jgi:hypothetical protein
MYKISDASYNVDGQGNLEDQCTASKGWDKAIFSGIDANSDAEPANFNTI